LAAAFDPRAIANLLLEEARSRKLRITNLKLQKLLFLCHAFYLVEKRNPLVRGSFEAWQYGPVHREAYEAFKQFGAKPITAEAEKFDPVAATRIKVAAPKDQAVIDIVGRVIQFYGALSPGRLVELTHAKDGPWDWIVRQASTDANIALKIDNQIILERFKYLWLGDKPNYHDREPNEDRPLIA
jgi:uncharacterized phage-associated protein